ncbi:MAG: 2-keto-4-pentenoate hydratase, partial [Terriglobia bacterium]
MRALNELADRQWRDYRARRPGTCFTDPDFALDLRQAYDLQQAVATLRIAAGDHVVGYKVGCTGPGTVSQFGMEGPIRGYLFDSEIHQTGDALDAANYAHLAIEGEMALRIDKDGQIVAAFPVIELHHFVFRASRKTLVELVANNGLNAGIVLPDDECQSSRTIADGAMLSVRINGKAVGMGGLWPMVDGPAASLAWLRDHLEKHRHALAPGQIVLAGTALDLY